MADSPRIEELKRRVQSDPASIAFAALAEEYRREDRFEEAIAACTAGLVRHPSYLSAHVTLGRALIAVGRLDEAKQELEYVLKLAPENLAAIRGLADIHHRGSDSALEHYPAGDPAVADHAPEMTVGEIHAMSGLADAPPGPATRISTPSGAEAPAHSALARLENLLSAIVRARAARADAR
jgi:tetratricopeptide (TPR) repeat protein